MSEDFRLPDLGEGLPEAELVQWLVSEGDTVTLNQTIAEVETAKAIVELPSPHAGTIRTLHAAAGDVVPVGSVFVTFDVEGEADAAAPVRASDTDVAEKAVPNLVGYGAAPRATSRPQRRARVAASAHSPVASSTAVLDAPVRDSSVRDAAVRDAAPHDAIVFSRADVDAPVERPRSTPPVRRLARDLGVDLAQVSASGPTGLITRSDVEAYAARSPRAGAGGASVAPAGASPSATSPSATSPSATSPRAVSPDDQDRITRTPIRGVRKFTAEAMVRSAFTAPHVTTFLTVDVTATTELITSLKTDRALDGHRIGVMAVAAKAVCLALARHPSLNSHWDAERDEIVEHHYVNLGIAAATERGLVVPNIPDADALNLVEMAHAITDLATTARSGRTTPARLRGGTFSITNVGVFGIDAGTPILNPGEAGILALGAVRRQPWEHHGDIALRDVMTLALSFDHRLVDGEQGARFLVDVGAVLREPGRAMLLR